MDVRCERCKTEYEFDDARITEVGVTVKCSTCGHVFKVKKKALVVTVPVKPGELELAHAPLTQPPLGSSPSSAAAGSMDRPSGEKAAPKEWKVRQANGNLFTFKDLTTLQKWIVERKVVRDDEISLTGENWKRLGNIAELATFFQVVEEAQRGAQLTALQSSGLLGLAAPAVPGEAAGAGAVAMPPVPPQAVSVYPVAPGPAGFPAAVPPGYGMAPPPGYPGYPPVASSPVAPSPLMPNPPAAAPFAPAQPASVGPAPPAAASDDDIKAAAGLKKRGAGKVLAVLAVLAILSGGAWAAYSFFWLPREEARLEAIRKLELLEAEKRAAEEKARLALTDVGTPRPDAGVQAPDTGSAVVPAASKEPVHDFDWYMERGDRMRERERAEEALDAYDEAASLEPDRAEPIAGRGLALFDMGSKLQAEAAFQQALRLNPRYGVAIIGLAETYRAQDKKDEALKYYQKYLDMFPNGPEASVARNAIKKLQD